MESYADSVPQNAIGASKYPTAIVYKDGKEVKKAEGMDGATMAEIGKLLM